MNDIKPNTTPTNTNEPLTLTITKGIVTNVVQQFNAIIKQQPNIKGEYKQVFEKGDKIINDSKGKQVKDYYRFAFYFIDKSHNPLGTQVLLYTSSYPISIKETKNKVELQAYKDFITNAISCFTDYLIARVYETTKDETESGSTGKVSGAGESKIIVEDRPKLII